MRGTGPQQGGQLGIVLMSDSRPGGRSRIHLATVDERVWRAALVGDCGGIR